MTSKAIITTATKVLKIAGSIIITAALVESGFQGGKALGDDIECTVDLIDSKINPTATIKGGLFGKDKTVNLRTGKCSDGTVLDQKKLDKIRKHN